MARLKRPGFTRFKARITGTRKEKLAEGERNVEGVSENVCMSCPCEYIPLSFPFAPSMNLILTRIVTCRQTRDAHTPPPPHTPVLMQVQTQMQKVAAAEGEARTAAEQARALQAQVETLQNMDRCVCVCVCVWG